MALNLNKQNANPNQQGTESPKKGFDLNKNSDSSKGKFNLSKEPIGGASDRINAGLEPQKKKSPIVLIATVAFLLGGVLIWFNGTGKNNSKSAANADSSESNSGITSNADNQFQNPSQSTTEDSSQRPASVNSNVDESNNSASETSINPSNTSGSSGSNSIVSGSAGDVQNTSVNNNFSNSPIDQKALLVIRGEYGVGKDRKIALGDEYLAVQAKVNSILRR